MTLIEIHGLLKENLGLFALVAAIIMSMIEVSRIKINPWTWLANIFLGSIFEKMDKIEKNVAKVEKKVDEGSAVTSRYRILRFDDEILHEVRHSKEHFDQILVDIKVYETFCNNNPDFENGKSVMAIRHIKSIYEKCSKENSFL